MTVSQRKNEVLLIWQTQNWSICCHSRVCQQSMAVTMACSSQDVVYCSGMAPLENKAREFFSNYTFSFSFFSFTFSLGIRWWLWFLETSFDEVLGRKFERPFLGVLMCLHLMWMGRMAARVLWCLLEILLLMVNFLGRQEPSPEQWVCLFAPLRISVAGYWVPLCNALPST